MVERPSNIRSIPSSKGHPAVDRNECQSHGNAEPSVNVDRGKAANAPIEWWSLDEVGHHHEISLAGPPQAATNAPRNGAKRRVFAIIMIFLLGDSAWCR